MNTNNTNRRFPLPGQDDSSQYSRPTPRPRPNAGGVYASQAKPTPRPASGSKLPSGPRQIGAFRPGGTQKPARAAAPASVGRPTQAVSRVATPRRQAPIADRSSYYADDSQQGRMAAEPTRHTTTRVAPVSYHGRGGGGGMGSGNGASPLLAKVLLGVVSCLVLVGVLGFCYVSMWRSVPVTVNGEEVSIRINSSVDDLLKSNEYFGAKAGDLLSVSGKVLEEGAGDRCAVSLGEGDEAQAVKAKDFGSTKVAENSVVTVADGADTTEKYTEDSSPIAPDVEMERGGAIQYVKQWGKNGKKAVWTGEQSGETVDKGVVEEPQNFIIGSANVQPKGDKKYMALTFDDGPSKYTQDILDILKKKGAKATFYNLGENAGYNGDLAKAVLDADCELASHTNAHENLPTLNKENLRSEITTAFDTLEGATGFRPQMIRAPYGAFGSSEWVRAGDLISCNVLWNIDTLDWELPGAAAITDAVLSGAFNGAIALMHDGGGNREQDIEALPGIIDGLQDAGYELVTVSELMALDDTFPKDVVNGTVKMPKDAVMPEV